MKNKIIMVAMIISIAAFSAHADTLFEDSYLSEIRVVNVDEKDGWALIQNRAGNESDIWVGDLIGWEQAVVVSIEKASIIVEQENLRTRMPVVDPFSDN